MKRLILSILALGVGIHLCVAQTSDTATNKTAKTIEAGWGDLNFAVPESPAFKILGTSPSDIMRPTSVKNIAFSIGNYLFTKGTAIPKNLAIEIAPSLFSPHVNLQDYNANRFWYTSALSIGTKVNTDKSYAIGLGYKITLLDKQDLRKSNVLIKRYDEYGPIINSEYAKAVRALALQLYAKDKSKTAEEYVSVINHAYNNNSDQQHSTISSAINDQINKKFDMNRISKIRDSVKNADWNKMIWQLGIAGLFNSKDSLLKDIKPISKVGLWSTFGLPIGSKGQLLIGVTAQLKDSLTSMLNIGTLNIGSRAYYGSNQVKGYIEADVLMQTQLMGTYKASVGIEGVPFGNVTVDFSLGVTAQNGGKTMFTPGLNLSFGNGEKKTAGD